MLRTAGECQVMIESMAARGFNRLNLIHCNVDHCWNSWTIDAKLLGCKVCLHQKKICQCSRSLVEKLSRRWFFLVVAVVAVFFKRDFLDLNPRLQEILRKARTGPLICHCLHGKNRSAALCVLLHMIMQGQDFHAAVSCLHLVVCFLLCALVCTLYFLLASVFQSQPSCLSRSLEMVIIGQSGLIQTETCQAAHIKRLRDRDLDDRQFVNTGSFQQLDCKNSIILEENQWAKESAKKHPFLIWSVLLWCSAMHGHVL